MYRNKIIIIFTVFVIGLLGFMIWSSNVVADHNAKQNEPAVQETAAEDNADIMEGDFAKEHLLNEEDDTQNKEIIDEPKPYLEVDNNNLEPQMVERLKSVDTIGRHYVDKLTDTSRLILWNKSTFPLKVYVKDEAALPPGFGDGIKTAFNNWQNASNNFISFDYIFTPDNADIIVEVVEKPADKCTFENEIERVYDIQGNRLKKVTLKVPKVNCEGENVEVANLYVSAQHHIGHLLGIEGHSASPSDVMFTKLSYENINITDIDVNTLKLLYNFVPQITNKPYTQAEIAKMPRLTKLKGMDKEQVDQFLANNIKLPGAKVDPLDEILAKALDYYNKDNLQMAISYYKDALSKADNRIDKAYVYRCMSLTYLKMGNRNGDALINANNAYEIANTPLNEYLLAYINFTMGKEDEALKHLETILKEYPKIRPAYALTAQIYERKRQNIKLEELAKLARDNFFDNPPVKINK